MQLEACHTDIAYDEFSGNGSNFWLPQVGSCQKRHKPAVPVLGGAINAGQMLSDCMDWSTCQWLHGKFCQ